MDDEVFCLFVVVACGVTLGMPPVAQTLFALLASGLVLAGYFSTDAVCSAKRAARDRHDVAGG